MKYTEQLTIRLPKELSERLDKVCKETYIPTSAFIRQAIDEKIKTENIDSNDSTINN